LELLKVYMVLNFRARGISQGVHKVVQTPPILIIIIKKKKALEGLAAVVNRVTCSAPVPGSTLYVHACHPRGALPAPGLAGCPVGREE